MPNYNMNEIKLVGTARDVKRFLEAYINPDSNEFDFTRIIPEPQIIDECPIECRVNENSHIQIDQARPWFDWYEWRYKFWGTKWNAWDTQYDKIEEAFPDIEDDDEIEYYISFTTAWCPPMPVFMKLCEDWHNVLNISCFYIEEGMGFCGTYDYINGDRCCEGGCDSLEFRDCTINWGYYSQEYWDEYDAEYGLDESESDDSIVC